MPGTPRKRRRVEGVCVSFRVSPAAFSLAAAAVALSAAAALSETAPQLRRAGFVDIWTGHAAMTTCMGPQDSVALGDYVFSCAVLPYGGLFWEGEATLWARLDQRGGVVVQVAAYLCFEARTGCMQGALARRR